MRTRKLQRQCVWQMARGVASACSVLRWPAGPYPAPKSCELCSKKVPSVLHRRSTMHAQDNTGMAWTRDAQGRPVAVCLTHGKVDTA
jgi:hypothetical protein